MSSNANLIIANARVITGDPEQSRDEAVAVAGNRIVFVGATRDAESWRNPSTHWIDAQSRTLLPGFIDSHFHLLMGSAELGNAQLDEVNSLDDLEVALRNFAQSHPENPEVGPSGMNSEWVNGSQLKYTILPEGQRLTRQHLDAIIPDRPVALMSYDYHTMWVNTRALEMAGILAGGETGPNSEIVMGANGLANGELREPSAYGKVLSLTGVWGRAASGLIGLQPDTFTPEDSKQERALLRQGLAMAARNGITSVHNMDGNVRQAALYTALEDSEELTARVYVPLSVTPETQPEALYEAVEMRQKNTRNKVRAGLVKFFMDGVMESWTAFLLDDYADRPGWKGESLYTLGSFTRMAAECDRLGLQIAAHAIGDAAVRLALDGFEAIQHRSGKHDSRHRIEHIELVHPSDMPRFAQLGVIASMQPLHVPSAGDLWSQRAGDSRWGRSFAWQSLRRAGARLVFGSDWPVVVQSPMRAIHAALNRQPWKPGLPDQRQCLENAIASFTWDAAYAEFQENEKGKLRAGLLADMVLLSTDLEQMPSDELQHACPVLTIFDGRIVYEQLS